MADRLGKTIAEIEQITIDEFNEWVAYHKIENEQNAADSNRSLSTDGRR